MSLRFLTRAKVDLRYVFCLRKMSGSLIIKQNTLYSQRRCPIKILLVIFAVSVLSGCAGMGKPCEDKWVAAYHSKGIQYVKENSACMSVTYKEPGVL